MTQYSEGHRVILTEIGQMLTFIDSADDIIAVKVANQITTRDLQDAMDRIDAALAKHAKVHFFVETEGIDGIELSGLSSILARAMPLFGELPRFDRIAVVADQTWVRMWARIESAILPFISYRIFTPDQREAALAWVTENRIS